jgi:glycosyltransferase involved in cell wall biosynthesis
LKRHSLVIDTIPLLSKFTGIAKYTFEISRRILEADQDLDLTFYYGYYRKKLYPPETAAASGEEKAAKKLKSLMVKNHFLKKIARNGMLLTSGLFHKGSELYWEPNNVPIKQIKSKHLVTTVHDFSFHIYPDHHPKERREYIKKHFWKNIGMSDRIITGSGVIKNEIIDFLKFDPAKISVIHHGVDHDNFKVYDRKILDDFRTRYELPDRFILFVGSIEPRKNLKNALLAYNSLPDEFKRRYKFLLAGFSGWNNAEVMEIINREKENIIYLEYLADRDLACLYNLAAAFIYPSVYEGFGLPPIEAMACGVPVIVSRASSMPEICGDAAYYIDPHDVKNIAEGIYAISTDDVLRQNLFRKSLQQAEAYDWDRSAKEHLAVFNEVMGT